MGRDDYEEKLEARRQRLLNRAARAEATSRAASREAGRIADAIPMGQPILVGHHSEKRHRRDLARMDRNMRTAVDSAGRAEELRRRAVERRFGRDQRGRPRGRS